MTPAPEDLLAAFAQAAASRSGASFVARDERRTRFSYAELWRRALRCAGGLRAAGIAAGDRVGIVLPTSPAFFDAFFGTLLARGVPVPLYPPVRLGRLDEYHHTTAGMLSAARARVVLTDARLRRLLGRTLDLALPPLGCRSVEEVCRGHAVERPALDPDALALVQFSSGTTVDPKPVALTHRQILANVRAILGAILAIYPEAPDRKHGCVSWLPLYHDMGLIGCLLAAVTHKAELTLIPPELFVARPALWLRTISQVRATVSVAPDFAYALCADRVRDEELAGVDLSSWLVALDGAEPVTPTALERFATRFGPKGFRREALTPVYGLSEAALAVTFAALAEPSRAVAFDDDLLASEGLALRRDDGRRLVSVGRPLAGYAVRLVDAAGDELVPDRLGRIFVRGPSLMAGYLDRAEASAAVLAGGWLDTGDLGFLHDGELFVYGRAKDLLVVRGRKFSPHLVEQALTGIEGIRPGCVAAVSGLLDEEHESLLVFVERRRGADPSGDPALIEAVVARVSERTGLVARRVVPLTAGTLPRTSSGKVRRSEALRRYRSGTLRPPAKGAALGLAVELLRSAWYRRRRRTSP